MSELKKRARKPSTKLRDVCEYGIGSTADYNAKIKKQKTEHKLPQIPQIKRKPEKYYYTYVYSSYPDEENSAFHPLQTFEIKNEDADQDCSDPPISQLSSGRCSNFDFRLFNDEQLAEIERELLESTFFM